MSKNADLIAKKKLELEKEITELDKQLQFYSKDVEQKKDTLSERNEFLSELVENYIQSERVSMLKKLIKHKSTEVENYAEAVAKKLEIVDDLAKKHSRITAERVAHSQHSTSILKRMVIEEDDRFGNMRSFESEMQNKKEGVTVAIVAATLDLAKKKRSMRCLPTP
uniref:Uncharacterized protein n=1 Tax=Ditylenchus dipsaci TaxID=166011 RepID=A0A915CZF5_9BILA